MKSIDLNPKTRLTATKLAAAFNRAYGISDDLVVAFQEDAIKAKSLGAARLHAVFDVWGRQGLAEYWSQALFVKSLDTKTPDQEREAQAIRSLLAAEAACARTNRRLQIWRRRRSPPKGVMRLPYLVLWEARKIVRQLMGVMDEKKLERIAQACRPGKGSAVGVVDREALGLPFKLDRDWTDATVTPEAEGLATELFRSHIGWARSWAKFRWDREAQVLWMDPQFTRCDASEIVFAPKNGTTLRAVQKPPSVNIVLQLGFADYMSEDILRPIGIDIRDQSANRRLAQEGSQHWLSPDPLCTMDLVGASDHLCTELVRWLTPPCWFEYLDLIRDHRFVLGGSEYRAEKFAAMGNGTTFPLQTIVFFAIARATANILGLDNTCRVYGDDIVVRRSLFGALWEVLRAFGFKVNTSKSFAFGPFRESCGGDYLAGTLITPLYIREVATLRVRDVYRVFNGFQLRGLTWLNDLLFAAVPYEVRLVGLVNEADSSCFQVPLAVAQQYAGRFTVRRTKSTTKGGKPCVLKHWELDESLAPVWWDKGEQAWRWLALTPLPRAPRVGAATLCWGAVFTSAPPPRPSLAAKWEIGRLPFGLWQQCHGETGVRPGAVVGEEQRLPIRGPVKWSLKRAVPGLSDPVWRSTVP